MARSKQKKNQRSSIKFQKQPKQLKPPKKTPAKESKECAVDPGGTVPFEAEHRILLVGEGDFSFSRSLLEHHECKRLHATSYDSRSASHSKYSQVAAHTKALEMETCKVEYGVDATKLGHPGGGGKDVRIGGWDRIVFNFPHVGGLTKDVNRQVRANQELLVGFFTSASPLLSSEGLLVVTLFDGEPYELWNVRDLARHIGLRVERSFKFWAAGYPKYRHARTLGNIEGGGGWRGEDRPARTYLLRTGDNVQAPTTSKKRKRDYSDSESE